MAVTFSKATEADIPVLTELLNEALQYKHDHGDSAWGDDAYTNEEVALRVKNNNTYLAQLDGQVVGTAILLWENPSIWGKQPPDAGYLHGLAIKDGYHGHDIGAQIIDWASQMVAQAGRDYLRLDCPSANQGLCSYYEKQGFTLVDTRPNPEDILSIDAYYQRPVNSA